VYKGTLRSPNITNTKMKSFVGALKCTTKPIVRASLRNIDVTNIQGAGYNKIPIMALY
jgi:hypothetical protein